VNNVSGFSPTISVHCTCSEALARVQRSLTRRGLRALETFDLQTARLASADCACPHHGMAECDCQMLVLMVYGEATAPTTLMLHGNDGQTWISLPDDPGRGLDALIAAAIEESVQDIRAAQGL
jgi:hypothetical protein